jgi:hypothetical protein
MRWTIDLLPEMKTFGHRKSALTEGLSRPTGGNLKLSQWQHKAGPTVATQRLCCTDFCRNPVR